MLVLIIGTLSVASLLLKLAFERFSLPPIVAYLLLGMLLAGLNRAFPLFDAEGQGGTVLAFLSALGVIVLLFRVGIESDLHELRQQLPRAAVIWPFNMILSGLPGYWVTHHLLGYALIPSLFVGVALTATSVGVSVAVWEETGKIKRKEGCLLNTCSSPPSFSSTSACSWIPRSSPPRSAWGVCCYWSPSSAK